MISSQKAELVRHRDSVVRLECELNKALKDLKSREWEVKQLEGRQDKTIVEHVHVLEEAKRLTDRQLADTQLELKKNEDYIRSLEKAKSRLMREAEDMARETAREHVESRTKEKTGKVQEERATRALADLERERQAREAAELQSRRLQNELQNTRHQVADLSGQLDAMQRSKNALEDELSKMADDIDTPNSMTERQRLVQQRTSQVELEHQRRQLHDLAKSKQHLQAQLVENRDELERAKNEHSSLQPLMSLGLLLIRSCRCEAPT
jgi:myosin protein heavy chain